MSKVGRPKGIPKTGGRRPGAPNRVTKELKQWLTALIEENQETFKENLSKLEPEKHVQIMERLFAYLIPKPQSLDLQIEYRELERLLAHTPEAYIERISAKIIELNTKNVSHE